MLIENKPHYFLNIFYLEILRSELQSNNEEMLEKGFQSSLSKNVIVSIFG
jgi:hypothetical protein